MKTIALTQGKVALVDDEDFERLTVYKWHVEKQVRKCRITWYAARKQPIRGGQKKVLMHREILGLADPKTQADHKSGDTLDNQKANLRVATNGQNKQNSRKATGCTSRFKGVSWSKRASRWEVRVRGKYAGLFRDELEAAHAYSEAAKAEFGEFALVN